MAQLGALGLQKGELLNLLPVLPLRHLPPMFGISHRVRQAAGILLIQLKEGDLPDMAFCILVSRG
jgi:hypothetical protein